MTIIIGLLICLNSYVLDCLAELREIRANGDRSYKLPRLTQFMLRLVSFVAAVTGYLVIAAGVLEHFGRLKGHL